MATVTFYDLIARNKRLTYLFIFLISILFGFAGYLIVKIFNWGTAGYIFFALFIIFYNLILYYNSAKLILTISNAKPADPDVYYQLHNIVEEVSIAGGIPKPKVYLMEEEFPNAFATGRSPKDACICVTTGLLRMMNREELQGVVAHEISHIRNYDTLLMTVVAIIGGLIVLFRDLFFRSLFLFGDRRDRRRGGSEGIFLLIGIIFAILAPILVLLIRLAISREREYLADASACYLTRYPRGLASALEKIGSFRGRLKTATDATAHLFIANPFGKDKFDFSELFATHPPIQKRIKRILELEI
jgi:heat shock protein HtpX|uniref:Protease HtpX homolog n=1 Tax=candidate division WOR-3 bacterium TaxID=2052148 RepID=A0A7C3UX68_UNCW3